MGPIWVYITVCIIQHIFRRYGDVAFAYSTEIFGIIKIKTKCKQWQQTVLVPDVLHNVYIVFLSSRNKVVNRKGTDKIKEKVSFKLFPDEDYVNRLECFTQRKRLLKEGG